MKKLLAFLCVAAMLLAGCQEAPAPAEHTHTLIHNVEKAPTCINNGIKEHWYCPECNGRFTDEAATKEVTFFDLEVEELGHIGGTATCTEAAICDRCGQPHGAALGHTWDDAEATAKNCTVCGIHVNASFAGGKGTAEEPYLVKNAQQLANITNFYDTYKYYKVADGVETIDMTGFGKILLNGSFDGNGVKIVNLNTALFLQAGYQNTAADIKISNLDVTMNATDGCALVRNIFNSGKTTFENVAVHGYIEGLYNMGSFFNYGTANCDGKGANYTVEFVNATSDATLVCTSGNVAGGFLGHSFEGTGNSFTMVIDANSAFTGKIMTTNGKGNLYFAMTSDYNNTNNHFIINGEEVKFNNGHIPAAANLAKISVIKPTAGETAYAVEAVEGATEFVVYLNAQVTAYDEEGYKIVNKNGMTWPLGHFGMDELAEMGLINSMVIVNGTDKAFGYEVADGVLTVYSGRSDSYESGSIYLQINQYNADGELLATGTLTVCTLEHDHTFVGTSCTTDGKCNCGATEKGGHTPGAAATCTAAQTCTVCEIELAPAKDHTPGAAATCTAAQVCTVCNTQLAPKLSHNYVDGICGDCSAVDPNYYFPVSIPEALAKAEGSKVIVTGTVTGFYETWSSYKNCSPYITDENGNQILIFRTTVNVGLGDKVTVKGVIGVYSKVNQIAAGNTLTIDEVHTCSDYTEATCENPAKCKVCGVAKDDVLADHNYVDGTCSGCGAVQGVVYEKESKDIFASAGKLASDKLSITWTSTNFTFTVNKADSTTAIRTSDANHFRAYQGTTATVAGVDGAKISSIVISNVSGYLPKFSNIAGATITTDGVVVTIKLAEPVDSIVLKNVADKQWRLTNIEVTYVK